VKILNFRHCALVTCAAIAIAGCGGSQTLGPSQFLDVPNSKAVLRDAGARNYRVMHSFGYGSDGSDPTAPLIDVKGTLYGTTFGGGKYALGEGHFPGGTVFSISVAGKEHVLHSFGKGSDGSGPPGGLVDVNGMLYDTTRSGGDYNLGTLFGISTAGKEDLLLSFDFKDGAFPAAGLIDVDGTLYGTTNSGGGGSYPQGTVFSFNPSTQQETVLHTFGSGTDGSGPDANLLDIKGTLYGTTSVGGAYGGGTIFRISTTGMDYRALHNFGYGSDGSDPQAPLIDVKGTLYGTTGAGGPYGQGIIFSISTTGSNYRVLPYDFIYSQGGGGPNGLLDVNGTFFDTTSAGGSYDGYYLGGVLFSISPTGKNYSVLHDFDTKAGDGSGPFAPLIDEGGTLYGTTLCGGAYGASGCNDPYARGGTVFAFKLGSNDAR
jgi:uncharacterized repeat protein (TIGR03803 family)